MKGKTFAPGVLLLLSVQSGLAQEPSSGEAPLSLESAVQRVLAHNPMMAAVDASEEAAYQGRREAEAARLPKLRLSEGFTRGNNPVFAFGSLLEQGRFGPQNFAIDSLNNPASLSNFRTSLDLQLPLLSRRAISSGIEQAKAGERLAAAQRELATQQLRFQAIEAYFGLQLAQERERVSQQTMEAARAEETRVGDLVEQGLRVRSDLLSAQAQRAEFEQRVIEAAGDVAAASAALNALMGQPLRQGVVLLGQLPSGAFPAPPLDTWLDEATSLRPEVLQSRARVEQARQELRAARGQWQPSLSMFAQYGASTHNWADGSADYAVGAQLSFDLVELGRQPRIQRALAQLRLAEATQRQEEQRVGLEVVQSHEQFRAAREKLTVAAAGVEQAREALRIVRDRHEVGITTITELLRAQSALLAAELNVLRARYQQTVSYAGLMLGAGRLTSIDPFIP